MPKILITIIIIACGMAFAIWDSVKSPPGVQTAIEHTALEPAPEITFTRIDGSQITLESLRGKTIFLNIWATWCAPCVIEIPHLLELAEREDIIFIALSVDKDIATIEKFLSTLPDEARDRLRLQNVIFAHDPDKGISKDQLGTAFYPETYIITPDLQIKTKIEGIIDWLGADVRDMID